ILAGTETLLVVEDQAPLRRAIARALRDFGYAVLEAGDGAGGVRAGAGDRGGIHPVVADGGVARRGGPGRAERPGGTRPEIRVLYVSGYTDDESFVGGGDRKVALLAKPFAPDVLGAKVRALLDDE